VFKTRSSVLLRSVLDDAIESWIETDLEEMQGLVIIALIRAYKVDSDPYSLA